MPKRGKGPEPAVELDSRVAFIRIKATDLDATADFYRRLIGMEEIGRRERPGGVREVLLAHTAPTRANRAIGLIAATHPKGWDNAEEDEPGGVLAQVVVAVSDPAALMTRVRDRLHVMRTGDGVPLIRDTAGNHVEVITAAELPDRPSERGPMNVIYAKTIVADDAAAADFYGSLLGFEETVNSRYVHKQRVRELVFSHTRPDEPQTGVITIRYPSDFVEVFDEEERFIRPHIVLDAPDSEALAARVAAAGFSRSKGKPVNIMDPAGNVIEIVQLAGT